MKKVLSCVMLLSVLFSPCTVAAAVVTDATLASLMKLSGLNRQMAELPATIKVGMEQASANDPAVSSDLLPQLAAIVDQAFDVAEITAGIAGKVKGSLSEAEARQLVAWLQSDVGREIVAAEERASSSAALEEMFATAETLMQDEKRVFLAMEMDGLLNATEFAVQLQKHAALSVFSALSKAVNPGKPVNVDGFMRMLSSQQSQMNAAAEQLVILSLVYSYQDVDLETMERYLEYLRQPASKKFHASVMTAMHTAFDRPLDKMMMAIVRFAEGQASQPVTPPKATASSTTSPDPAGETPTRKFEPPKPTGPTYESMIKTSEELNSSGMITVKCPTCGDTIGYYPDMSGMLVKCGKCGEKRLLP